MILSLTSNVYAEENPEINITQISISNDSMRIDWTPIANITGYNVIYKDKNKNQITKNFISKNNSFDTLKNYKNVAYIEILGVMEGGKTVQKGIELEQSNGFPLDVNPVILGASIIDGKTKIVINPDLIPESISVIVDGTEYPVDINTGYIEKEFLGKKRFLCKVVLKSSRTIYGTLEEEFIDMKNVTPEKTECSLYGRNMFEGGYVQYLTDAGNAFMVKTMDEFMQETGSFILDGTNEFTVSLPEGTRYIKIIGVDDGPELIDDLAQPFDTQLAAHVEAHPFLPYTFAFESNHKDEEETEDCYLIPKIKMNDETFLNILVNGQMVYQDLSTKSVGSIKVPLRIGENQISLIAHTLDGQSDMRTFIVTRNKQEIPLWSEVAPIVSDEIEEITMSFEKDYDGLIVSMPYVYIAGTVTGATSMLVNGVDLNLDINGNFEAQVSLKEGNNVVSIKAINDTGGMYTKELNIVYEVPNLIIDVNDLKEIDKEYKKIPENEEQIDTLEETDSIPTYDEILENPGSNNEAFIYAVLIASFLLLIIILLNYRSYKRRKNKDN